MVSFTVVKLLKRSYFLPLKSETMPEAVHIT